MVTQYVFQIQHTPDMLTRMIDVVRPEQYDEALEPELFTLREVIAHLSDWEVIWLDRITMAVEYPGSVVESQDPDARAKEHSYSSKDIHHELEVFGNRRRDTVDYILRLAVDDWEKSIVHSTNGVMTVLDLVNFVIGHDMYHLNQVSLYMK